ncbi:nucleotide exchange factor SIL1 isoform X2 [Bombina bombina]|nr:nucleotide exchange factor SIL1 isoform X2 [Bombina bombina]XP_053574525.1 nucleotide exchange factor SIL1 isoform X2 [Bombina bombina]
MGLHNPFRYTTVKMKLSTFILFSFCFYSCFSDQAKDYPLTVVEEAEIESHNEAIVEDDDYKEDQEIFYPTREWQVVKPGQAVPAGLHIRLNLQTGQNEAKLLDENDDLKSQESTHRKSDGYTTKELKEALAKFKEGTESQDPKNEKAYIEDVKKKFRPIEELKKSFSELNIRVETDFEIMTRIINTFNNSISTTDEKVHALYDLEYYVHQVDNAQNLFKSGGLQLLINSLNSTEPVLIEHSAFVIGSALASNPKVQVAAFEGGALQKLLVVLAMDNEPSVKKKALFALSALLRQFPYAQQQFLKLGGLQILKNVFKGKNAEMLYVRVITLMYDMIMEKMLNKESNITQKNERIQQYEQINILPAITEQGWCTMISNLLNLSENDAREKVLKIVSILITPCRNEFLKDQNLHTALDSLKKEYEDLASEEQSAGEKDGYFNELHNLIINIVDKLK